MFEFKELGNLVWLEFAKLQRSAGMISSNQSFTARLSVPIWAFHDIDLDGVSMVSIRISNIFRPSNFKGAVPFTPSGLLRFLSNGRFKAQDPHGQPQENGWCYHSTFPQSFCLSWPVH